MFIIISNFIKDSLLETKETCFVPVLSKYFSERNTFLIDTEKPCNICICYASGRYVCRNRICENLKCQEKDEVINRCCKILYCDSIYFYIKGIWKSLGNILVILSVVVVFIGVNIGGYFGIYVFLIFIFKRVVRTSPIRLSVVDIDEIGVFFIYIQKLLEVLMKI